RVGKGVWKRSQIVGIVRQVNGNEKDSAAAEGAVHGAAVIQIQGAVVDKLTAAAIYGTRIGHRDRFADWDVEAAIDGEVLAFGDGQRRLQGVQRQIAIDGIGAAVLNQS